MLRVHLKLQISGWAFKPNYNFGHCSKMNFNFKFKSQWSNQLVLSLGCPTWNSNFESTIMMYNPILFIGTCLLHWVRPVPPQDVFYVLLRGLFVLVRVLRVVHKWRHRISREGVGVKNWRKCMIHKGAFTNYVDKFLALSTDYPPRLTFATILINVDTFLLPT